MFASNLYAQAWQKIERENDWGDKTGKYYYAQEIKCTGTSKVFTGGEIWAMWVQWADNTDSIIVSVGVDVLENWVAPVAVFVDEKINIAIRDANGTVQEFAGNLTSKDSNTSFARIRCINKQLVQALKKSGTHTLLIKGDDWQARGSVLGGLPSK
jgi:hypothetical protein